MVQLIIRSKNMKPQIYFFLFCQLWSLALLQNSDSDGDTQSLCSRCICQRSENNATLNLDCSKQSFKNIITNWPEHKENLVATFSYNNITRLEALPNTEAKISVSFDHCEISDLASGLLENTANIVFLDLSYNIIESTELAADVFKGPYNNTIYEPLALRHLDLSYNKIHSLQKDVFEHLPFLEVLNLEGNHFRVLDIVTQLALSSVPTLQVLNLANNDLTDLADDAVKQLTKLTQINLSGNDLDFVPDTLVYVAKTLEVLRVDDNPIIELSDSTFNGMENLRELHLNHLTKLRRVMANTFAPLKNLKVLSLANNNELTEIDRQAFGENQVIPEIYLQNNSLTTIDADLLPWSELSILEMSDNDFYCSCVLYNISMKLSESIKNYKDGPRCLHPFNYESRQIYQLKIDICLEQPTIVRYPGRDSFKAMRVSLVTLCVILVLSTMVAVWLGWSKWRSFQRSRDYNISHIVYNPLTNVHI